MAERLRRPLLYSFGVGDLFFTLLVCMEVYFFSAFLTDYAKFSLKIYSIIVYATDFGDILCALAAGVVLQRLSAKLKGGYRSWLLLCPPIVVPLFILQFSKIGGEYTAAGIIIFGFLASHLLWHDLFAGCDERNRGSNILFRIKDRRKRCSENAGRNRGQVAPAG